MTAPPMEKNRAATAEAGMEVGAVVGVGERRYSINYANSREVVVVVVGGCVRGGRAGAGCAGESSAVAGGAFESGDSGEDLCGGVAGV